MSAAIKREMPLPCPFCAKEPMFYSQQDVVDKYDHSFTIYCSTCGIEMCAEYESEVVANWNTRGGVAPTLEDEEGDEEEQPVSDTLKFLHVSHTPMALDDVRAGGEIGEVELPKKSPPIQKNIA